MTNTDFNPNSFLVPDQSTTSTAQGGSNAFLAGLKAGMGVQQQKQQQAQQQAQLQKDNQASAAPIRNWLQGLLNPGQQTTISTNSTDATTPSTLPTDATLWSGLWR
jgi:hypothetical protein